MNILILFNYYEVHLFHILLLAINTIFYNLESLKWKLTNKKISKENINVKGLTYQNIYHILIYNMIIILFTYFF